MSHASGIIKFKSDNKIGHYEYDGTADVVISHWYETAEERNNDWRKGEWLSCSCGGQEDVDIYSDYGNGFCMEGKACRKCKSIFCDIEAEHLETQEWVKQHYQNNK